jgi:hypothetical protein
VVALVVVISLVVVPLTATNFDSQEGEYEWLNI